MQGPPEAHHQKTAELKEQCGVSGEMAVTLKLVQLKSCQQAKHHLTTRAAP